MHHSRAKVEHFLTAGATANLRRSALRKKGFISVVFRGTVHHREEVLAQELEAMSRCIPNQEAQRVQTALALHSAQDSYHRVVPLTVKG